MNEILYTKILLQMYPSYFLTYFTINLIIELRL